MMTVEPMLRLIAGVFVLLSALLGIYVDHRWFWFTLFVGANLLQSAFTGWCPMMTILRKLGVKDGGTDDRRPALTTVVRRCRAVVRDDGVPGTTVFTGRR